MLAITQFEVYAFAKGRWTLHARYPGEERNEAIMDARNTEALTGFPTKVLRETYFPEVNNSETVTAYISPKAKEAQQNARAASATVIAHPAAAQNAKRRSMRAGGRPRLTMSQVLFRIVVAGGISLVLSTLIAGIVSWAMNWVAEAGGLSISPTARTTTLTYTYVLAFLYMFYSLYRSRLPLHRYLSDLWQKASAQSQPEASLPAIDGKPPKVKPKHNRPPSPETLREWEDLKVKRGDLDSIAAVEMPEALMPAATTASPEQPEAKPQTAIEKIADDVAAPPSLAEAEKAAEAKKKEKEKKDKEKATAEAAEAKKIAEKKEAERKEAERQEKAAAETLAKDLNLERMVLRRFASDVVKPAIKSAMSDDPVARRGAAVVLAGGAAGIAATSRLGGNAEIDLLNDALRHIGMNQAAVDTFMGQHTQLTSAPTNAELIDAGRRALSAYLEGASDVVATLARALTSWRTPFAHPSLVPFNASAENAMLADVYMMTELRAQHASDDESDAEAIHDHAMGAHNSVVRNVLAAHGGHEVKHTGKGIFSRFGTAASAIDAAMDIQRQFRDDRAQLAIGIVGNTAEGEDTILSDKLVRQAQAILARTGAGEILCENRVRAAADHERNMDSPTERAAEELDLVRLVVTPSGSDAPEASPAADVRQA